MRGEAPRIHRWASPGRMPALGVAHLPAVWRIGREWTLDASRRYGAPVKGDKSVEKGG